MQFCPFLPQLCQQVIKYLLRYSDATTLFSFVKRLRDPKDDTFRHLQIKSSLLCVWSSAACYFMAFAQLVFYYALQITCVLQPSDVSGQCRGTTWPTERTSSQLHSSSFHEQTNEQSGKSPPMMGQMSFSSLKSN